MAAGARLGEVRTGWAWFGGYRQGSRGGARPVLAGWAKAWSGSNGADWQGVASSGWARHGKPGSEGGEKLAKYEWKIMQYKVDPQAAGELLEDISKRDGGIKPKAVVDESRPKDALLHECFEWRDNIAGELYREVQAKSIIRNIVIVPTPEVEHKKVRAFVHINQPEEKKSHYLPIDTVMVDGTMRQQMLETALKELAAFRKKYQDLNELSNVLRAIEEMTAENTA